MTKDFENRDFDGGELFELSILFCFVFYFEFFSFKKYIYIYFFLPLPPPKPEEKVFIISSSLGEEKKRFHHPVSPLICPMRLREILIITYYLFVVSTAPSCIIHTYVFVCTYHIIHIWGEKRKERKKKLNIQIHTVCTCTLFHLE